MTLILGEYNTCINCGAKYSTYKEGNDNYKEEWCKASNLDKKPKGLCQFCNPKSKFYNK